MTHKLAVIAIGGNSLIVDEKNVSVESQYKAAKETAVHIADMIEQGWEVAIGHGNGPQVGFILRRSEIAARVEGIKEIVELETVQTLLEKGIVTITVGGGGIPVVDPGDGNYEGIAAVVDKDYASSLLARELEADLFVISTAVEKVAVHFGKPEQKWLDKITLAEAKAYLAEGIHFAKGSMAPKIQAVIWFLENGGKEALITNPENIGRALKGETGTRIVR
ncbi:MAG: hypothetical protein IPN58_13285 [Anaerolineales bacterium]|nr:hypothetical protein [Anaerolineales bacterium]